MRDVIRGGSIVYGLLAAGLSALAALLLTALAVASGGNGTPAVMTSTVIVSLVVLGCGLGLPLALAGWHSLQGRASPRLRLPPIWLLLWCSSALSDWERLFCTLGLPPQSCCRRYTSSPPQCPR